MDQFTATGEPRYKGSARIQEIRNENGGTLPVFAWPGGYPIYYVTRTGRIICPACANTGAFYVRDSDVNWEDPDMICGNEDCGKRIPSAYAEDEDDDSEMAESDMVCVAGDGH